MTWIWRQLHRAYRLMTWLRATAGRRLTPAGGLVLGSMCYALFIGFNRENTVTYQAFALLLFLCGTAVTAAFFFRMKFSVRRALPPATAFTRWTGPYRPSRGWSMMASARD